MISFLLFLIYDFGQHTFEIFTLIVQMILLFHSYAEIPVKNDHSELGTRRIGNQVYSRPTKVVVSVDGVRYQR